MTCLFFCFPELAKFWSSASYYLSQQLAFYQVGLASLSFPPSHGRFSRESPFATERRYSSPLWKQESCPRRTLQCKMGHRLAPLSVLTCQEVQA